MDLRRTPRALIGPVFVLVVFVAALWLLHAELKQYDLRDFGESVSRIPRYALVLAVGLTILDYGILALYELLGRRYLGHGIGAGRVVLASILGYALGHNFGVLLGGSTVRYRLYTVWGLSAFDVLRLMFFLWVTFAVGLSALGGLVFLVEPLPIPAGLHLPVQSSRALGAVLALSAVAYLLLCALRRAPLRFRKLDFSPPSTGLGVLQCLVAAADLVVAAAVLYMLLPASSDVGYVRVLAIYLLAIVATFMSQVPGGVGVLELVVILLLRPPEPHAVFSALLVYRVVFYLMPLGFALLLLSVNELSIHGARARQLVAALGRWPSLVTPRLMPLGVFITGALMLFSSATPLDSPRVAALLQRVPLAAIEISHFALSVAGVSLLVLTRGLQRRIAAAYWLTLALLAAGAACALLKGLAYEECLVFALMLVLMLPARRDFYRRRALVAERFSATWFIAFALVVAGTVWLMSFAYPQLDYRHDLWWQFAAEADGPRSLRAMVGVIGIILLVACIWLLRPRPRLPGLPTERELETIRPIIEHATRTRAHLALWGGNRLVIHESGGAFLMFRPAGRSWVAFGDPVGDEFAAREVAWDFRELCDELGSRPVFYLVSQERLSIYVEMGLTLVRLADEARVPLAAFAPESGPRSELGRTFRRFADDGVTLEVSQQPGETAVLQELLQMSGNWPSAHGPLVAESLSLGTSPADIVRHSSVARVRRGQDTLALAAVGRTTDKTELSLDWLGLHTGAPEGIRDFLLTSLMLWGKDQGFQYFNLGIAPLAAGTAAPLRPLWKRMAAAAAQGDEAPDNFQRLRADVERYWPEWTPRFLASPGGFALPLVLSDIAALVAGNETVQQT